MNKEVFRLSSQLNESMTTPEPKPRGLTLYDLADSLTAIDEMLDESDGELTPEIEDRLDALRGKWSEKVDSICSLWRNNASDADACEFEAERLLKRAKTKRRKAASVRTYLMSGLMRAGESKVKTPRFTVWIQKSRPSIRWTRALEELPARFARIKREANLAEAQAAHEAGEALPEGFEIEHGQHLRIL